MCVCAWHVHTILFFFPLFFSFYSFFLSLTLRAKLLVFGYKGVPEPPENEINKILGSKREDRFSDHFSDLVQNIYSVRFSYLLRLSIFCEVPRDMRKFPQKCQKIAGCYESAVYGSRPLIDSKPDSSPPERPGLDNITCQPWYEATCPCTSFVCAYLRFVTIFLLEKTRQSTRSGGTGASCGRPWLTRDIVYNSSFRRG